MPSPSRWIAARLAGKLLAAWRSACRLALSVASLSAPVLVPVGAAESTGVQQLERALYEFEVAAYCGLVTDAVGAGFQREVVRMRAALALDAAAWQWLRGQAWQAAHEEWQNRGLGGFRAWCRGEGQAAAARFEAVPP